ncbi:MAG TPA: putative sugar nucleotidyl transferase [Luteibaculaceae bacterium]|nr:putative sugar nucleotidyl transferase [Luteibaculaceae bacterium]
MNFILVDTAPHRFYPLSLTRPVAHIRVGILTLFDKWRKRMPHQSWSCLSVDYLRLKFPLLIHADNVLVESTLLPDDRLCKRLQELRHNQALAYQGKVIAIRIDGARLQQEPERESLAAWLDLNTEVVEYLEGCRFVEGITDLFTRNQLWIQQDFEFLTHKKNSHPAHPSNTVFGNQLFLKSGVQMRACIINTESGPVYIDKDAEVMEGSMLRGPLYIGKGAQIKMGAKVYGPTTIGPQCRIGGEVSNSVFQGYANKGHDGFVGNSVIGEWCNLGADTNTSNLKNNYGEVRLYDQPSGDFLPSGLQFCGLLMGDHSKSAINTQFNTGTTVGVMANVFRSGFPPKFIPSFSWMGNDDNKRFDLDKGLELAAKVMERRSVALDSEDQAIYQWLYQQPGI